MKSFFVLVMFALLLVGCDKSNPTSSNSATTTTSDVAFSEQSMLKTTTVPVLQITPAITDSAVHDSLRNVRMLDSLKAYVGLSDIQFDSVKIYGAKLFSTLLDIRTQVQAHTISRDSAQALVVIARNQFITSVTAILTTDQVTLFDAWIVKFWDRRHCGPLGGGFGGRGGHEGHGGGGHGEGSGPKGGRP